MALERQRIEKKDFPIGRRGYDPDAVDTHLAQVAEEVERLKAQNRRRTETLATAASQQVRAIVEAAERSAEEIQRQAEDEAYEIRSEASTEAQTMRQQATAQAREYVEQVSEATAAMLQRIDAMETEVSGLLEALKTGAHRLNADLQLLEGSVAEVKGTVAPRPRFEPEVSAPATRPAPSERSAEPAAVEAPEFDDDAAPTPVAAQQAAPVFEAPADPNPSAAGGEDEDAEGARLVALNMALNGTAREETDRYLAENFALPNRAALLDEVYASVEG